MGKAMLVNHFGHGLRETTIHIKHIIKGVKRCNGILPNLVVMVVANAGNSATTLQIKGDTIPHNPRTLTTKPFGTFNSCKRSDIPKRK